MEKVTLNVEGMSCGHCVKSVEGSLGKLEGISKKSILITEPWMLNLTLLKSELTQLKKQLMTKDMKLSKKSIKKESACLARFLFRFNIPCVGILQK